MYNLLNVECSQRLGEELGAVVEEVIAAHVDAGKGLLRGTAERIYRPGNLE